jgi:hypothetical protein
MREATSYANLCLADDAVMPHNTFCCHMLEEVTESLSLSMSGFLLVEFQAATMWIRACECKR